MRATWLGAALGALAMSVGCHETVAPKNPPATVPPPVQLGSITLSSSNSVHEVGDTIRLRATVLDSAGHAIANAVVHWSSSDSAVATVDSTGLVTARSGGQVAVITASVGTLQASHRLAVNPTVFLRAGDSASFTFFYPTSGPIILSLTAGDTIDVGAWNSGSNLFYPYIAWDSVASGGHVAGMAPTITTTDSDSRRGQILPGFVVPVTGKYVFRMQASVLSGRCVTDPPGTCSVSAIVRTRRSAPIVVAPGPHIVRGRTNAGAIDTLTIANLGAGDLPLTVQYVPASVTVTPAATVVHGKSSAAFVLTSPSGAPGSVSDSIVFSGIAPSVWNAGWRSTPLFIRLEEPSADLTSSIDLEAIVMGPAHRLVGRGKASTLFGSATLYDVDVRTGHAEFIATLPDTTNQLGWHMTFGADSLLYVLRLSGLPYRLGVWTMDGAKTLRRGVTLSTWANASAITREHVLYTTVPNVDDPALSWWSLADGLRLGSMPIVCCSTRGIVVSPLDGAVYYADDGRIIVTDLRGQLHRLERGTNSKVDLGSIVGALTAIDERGYLYAAYSAQDGISINVYDPSGRLVDTRWPALSSPNPYEAATVAVDTDWIYVMQSSQPRTIVKLPVKRY